MRMIDPANGIGIAQPKHVALESLSRASVPAKETEIVIEAHSGWRVVNVGELWRARELMFFLAWRDVKVRYKQTVLGAAWALLQPLAAMLVFTLFLRRVA